MLLLAWARRQAEGFGAAEGALEEDETYLQPVGVAVARDAELKQAAARLLDAGGRQRFPRLNPMSPLVRLYFEGLLRRDDGWLTVRCAAVERLLREAVQ